MQAVVNMSLYVPIPNKPNTHADNSSVLCCVALSKPLHPLCHLSFCSSAIYVEEEAQRLRLALIQLSINSKELVLILHPKVSSALFRRLKIEIRRWSQRYILDIRRMVVISKHFDTGFAVRLWKAIRYDGEVDERIRMTVFLKKRGCHSEGRDPYLW